MTYTKELVTTVKVEKNELANILLSKENVNVKFITAIAYCEGVESGIEFTITEYAPQ